MVEATYTLTQAEFIEAQKIWCPQQVRKLPGHWVLNAVYLIFGAFLGWGLHYLPFWLGLTQYGLLLTIVGIQMWRRKAIRVHQYRMFAEQFQQVHVIFDETGYHDEKEDACGGWIAWRGFTGWKETESIFVIGQGLRYVTVPKVGLTGEQQSELKAMLIANVKTQILSAL